MQASRVHDEASDARRLAEAVRHACIAAALDGYEQASLSGLCHEGAWEAAVSAIRRIDVAALSQADPRSVRVRDAMTSGVATLRTGDPLSIADDVMRVGRIRHLPVVDEAGALRGIVSHRDVLRGSLQLKELSIGEVMTPDVVVTTPDAWLHEAAKEMFVRKLGCLPVVDDGKLVGIVTEADFVRLAL